MWDFVEKNWISLVALIISIISFFKDNIKDIIKYQKNKKTNETAKITVSYINDKLIISNKGLSNAKNIRVYIDNIEIEHSTMFAAYARNIDFSLLTSGNSIGIRSVKSMGSKTNYKIKVKWEDKKSKNNEIEDVINTF